MNRPAVPHTCAVSDGAEHHLKAALRHESAADNHDRSATFWEKKGKHEHARLQREMAAYERHGAELERRWAELMDPGPTARAVSAAESAKSLTRKNAEHARSALNRMAEALEHTAAVAEQHALRHQESGSSVGADAERQAAKRARNYADRARSQAEDWRKLAEQPTE